MQKAWGYFKNEDWHLYCKKKKKRKKTTTEKKNFLLGHMWQIAVFPLKTI